MSAGMLLLVALLAAGALALLHAWAACVLAGRVDDEQGRGE